jgi:hydroxyacylglutathione hydrolase
MRISDNIYVYLWNNPEENNCNSIFIDGKVPTLIDPGHSHRLGMLFSRMREDRVDPGKVRLVICTHAHPDHFEGAGAFGESVKIAISREEEKYIEEIGRPTYLQQGVPMPKHRVDFYLKEGDLVLGKHEFEIIGTPGHTPGGISVHWPQHRLLLSGDTLFARGVGRTDMPGGDAALLKKSIQRLSRLHVELIVPGHGPAIQGAQNVAENYKFIANIASGSK